MTGAGSGELLLAHEQTLGGSLVDDDSDSNPDWYQAGRNPSLTELDLDRQLQRLRDGVSPEAAESVAQNVDGAVGLEAVVSSDVHDQIEQVVFNDGGTAFTPGRPNSARIATEVNYLDGTVDRILYGCIPLSYELNWEQGGMVSYSLSMGYVEEKTDQTISLTDVTEVTTGTSTAFHDATLSIDGTSIQKLQSATLTVDNIARFQRGGGPKASDAVIAAPEVSLSFEAIITGPDRLEIAYGAADATAIQDTMDSVPGEFDIAANGTDISTYTLPQVKPNTLSWGSVIDTEDTTESLDCHVSGGISVA